MKKIFLVLLLPGYLYSQAWVDMMLDPSVNFYETQQEFENYWQNKSIENNQSTLKIDINATRFNFNIIEVRSVADVNVQFKHLYHLRSYEELKEIIS